MDTRFRRDPGLQLDCDNGARYFLWNKVLAMMSPVMAGQVLTLTPISGFFLSTMIFGGAITADIVASILLIVIGLVLTLRR